MGAWDDALREYLENFTTLIRPDSRLVEQELLTKRLPYHLLRTNGQVVLAIMQGTLPEEPKHLDELSEGSRELWDICCSCWSKDPKFRPTVRDIVSQLGERVEKFEMRPMPLHNPPVYAWPNLTKRTVPTD